MGTTPLKLEGTNGDLKEMSTTDENYLAYVVGLGLNSSYASSPAAMGNLSTSSQGFFGGTNIGSFSDTVFDQNVGDHGSLTLTTTTTSLYQTNPGFGMALDIYDDYRPCIEFVDNSGEPEIHQFNDTEMTTLTDRLLSRVMTSEYPGTFRLGTSSPSGDYTTHISNVFSDTRTDGSSIAYNIYRRQTMSAPTTVRPLKLKTQSNIKNGTYDGLQEMSDAEIDFIFGDGHSEAGGGPQRRVMNSKIGTYQLRSSAQGAPTDTGTWSARGSATDTRNAVSDTDYSANYQGNYQSEFTADYAGEFTTSYGSVFTGDFIGNYTGNFNRVFTGDFSRTFTGNFTGNFDRIFTGTFTGNFVRDFTGNFLRDFTAAFAREFEGNFLRDFVGNFSREFVREFQGNFSREFTGNFTRDFTGAFDRNFTGNFQREFTGNFDRNFTADYTGDFERNFTGDFQGDYTGEFEGNFTGNFERNFQVSYFRDFNRNFTVDYLGNFARDFSGDFTGNFQREFVRTFSGNFTGNFTGGFTGDFVRTFSGDFISTFDRNYTGNYTGNFVRDFTGIFTGNFIRSFVRSYTGAFDRNFVRTYTGNFEGNFIKPTYTGDFVRSFVRTYTGNFARDFAGTYTGNFTGSASYDGYGEPFEINVSSRTRLTGWAVESVPNNAGANPGGLGYATDHQHTLYWFGEKIHTFRSSGVQMLEGVAVDQTNGDAPTVFPNGVLAPDGLIYYCADNPGQVYLGYIGRAYVKIYPIKRTITRAGHIDSKSFIAGDKDMQGGHVDPSNPNLFTRIEGDADATGYVRADGSNPGGYFVGYSRNVSPSWPSFYTRNSNGFIGGFSASNPGLGPTPTPTVYTSLYIFFGNGRENQSFGASPPSGAVLEFSNSEFVGANPTVQTAFASATPINYTGNFTGNFAGTSSGGNYVYGPIANAPAAPRPATRSGTFVGGGAATNYTRTSTRVQSSPGPDVNYVGAGEGSFAAFGFTADVAPSFIAGTTYIGNFLPTYVGSQTSTRGAAETFSTSYTTGYNTSSNVNSTRVALGAFSGQSYTTGYNVSSNVNYSNDFNVSSNVTSTRDISEVFVRNFTTTSTRSSNQTFDGANYSRIENVNSTRTDNTSFSGATSTVTSNVNSVREFTSNSTINSVRNFTTNSVANFITTFFVGDSIQDFAGAGTTGVSTRNSPATFVGANSTVTSTDNYTAVSTRTFDTAFTTNSNVNSTANSNVNFSRDFTQDFTSDSTVTSTANSTINSVVESTSVYTSDFTTVSVSEFERAYTSDFTTVFTTTSTANSTTDSTGSSTRDSQRNQDQIFTREFQSIYTRDSQRNRTVDSGTSRDSNFSRISTRDFVAEFVGDYVGNYVGSEIQASGTTIETYTLYVRTA